MKKLIKIAACALIAAFIAGCAAKDKVVIAVPNDTTNEARALLLLQEMGYIKLSPDAGIQATARDITEANGIEIREVEAAQLPNVLKDVDFAVINSNFAIAAGLNPVKNALVIEGAFSAYANIVAVKSGTENSAKIQALVAALTSQKVADFISKTYDGSVVSVVKNAGDGYANQVDYAQLSGSEIKIAASPTPHSEILAVAAKILKAKDITLKIIEFSDYVQPNNVVESGECDANYFQHLPYLEDFNRENGTHLISATAVHVEPMGLYGGRRDSLVSLKKIDGESK